MMAHVISALACGFVCVNVMMDKMDSSMSDSCVYVINYH